MGVSAIGSVATQKLEILSFESSSGILINISFDSNVTLIRDGEIASSISLNLSLHSFITGAEYLNDKILYRSSYTGQNCRDVIDNSFILFDDNVTKVTHEEYDARWQSFTVEEDKLGYVDRYVRIVQEFCQPYIEHIIALLDSLEIEEKSIDVTLLPKFHQTRVNCFQLFMTGQITEFAKFVDIFEECLTKRGVGLKYIVLLAKDKNNLLSKLPFDCLNLIASFGVMKIRHHPVESQFSACNGAKVLAEMPTFQQLFTSF